MKTFSSRFYRIISVAYSVIFLCALMLFVFLFQENQEARLNSIRLRLIEQTQSLDSLLRVRYDAVNAIRSQAEDFLIYPCPEEFLPKLILKNNEDKNYFDLDVSTLNYHRVGNITGVGRVENLLPEVLNEIKIAYALNPLFKVLKENIRTSVFYYYISKNGFRNSYPWRPASETRFFMSTLRQEFFENSRPEVNPNKSLVWSDPFINPITNEMMVTCAAPVYRHKEFMGVVAMDFHMMAVEYFIDRIYYESGRLLVVNNKSTVICDTDDVTVPARIIKIQDTLPPGLTMEMINTVEDFSLSRLNDYWVFRAKHDYGPWKVIFYVKTMDVALATLRNVGPSVVLILLFAMFFLIFSNKLISREFIKPAQRLVTHISTQAQDRSSYQDILEPWHSWFDAVTSVFEENRKLVVKLEEHISDLDRKVLTRTNTISAKNRELQHALVNLRKAQDHIVTQEKLAGLGAITAGIAHEIKNPLNFIINFTEVSQEFLTELLEHIDALPQNVSTVDYDEINRLHKNLQENLERIVTHAKRADVIIRSMLTHARGGQDTLQLTDVNSLIEDNILLAISGIKGYGAVLPEVLRSLDKNLAKMKVYRQELGRVLLNILSNACYILDQKKQQDHDFMPLLQVSTVDKEQHIEIHIRDNGLGMSEKTRKQIFDPFFTTKPAGSGTGLGMSLSYDIIVNQHYGEIRVDTEQGEFTQFTLILPKKLE